MLMDCRLMLTNDHLVKILLSRNIVGETKVHDCFKKLFTETLIYILLKKRQGLPYADVLKLIAEEAFNDAFTTLVEKVRDGTFKTEADVKPTASSVSYFLKILSNKFQNALKLRHNKKMDLLMERHEETYRISENILIYNRPDGVATIVTMTIRKLDEKCRNYMHWQYVEGIDTNDIIRRVTDAPGTVKKDMANCRKKLLEKIIKDYDIRF